MTSIARAMSTSPCGALNPDLLLQQAQIVTSYPQILRRGIVTIILASAMEGIMYSIPFLVHHKLMCIFRDISGSTILIRHYYGVCDITIPFSICFIHKSSRKKHKLKSHYILLGALLVMLTATGIFWAGIITNVLGNLNAASQDLAQLKDWVSCPPKCGETVMSCPLPRGSTGFSTRYYYLTTVALVVVVR